MSMNNYTLITTNTQLRQVTDHLSRVRTIYVDTETTGLDPYQAKVLTVQLYDGEFAFIVDATAPVDLKLLNPLWSNDRVVKVFHNSAFDLKIIYKMSGGILPQNVYDTMITERMLVAGLTDLKSGLAVVAKRRLGVELDKSVRDTFVGGDGSALTEAQLEYAIKDVLVLKPIKEQQELEIAEHKLERVHKLEMELCPITAFIEYTGMPFNPNHLHKLEPVFENLIRNSERVLQDLFISAGTTTQIVFSKDGYSAFNPSSPTQMLAMFLRVGIDLPDLNARSVTQWDFRNRKSAKKFAVDFSEYTDDSEVSDAMENFGSFENKYIQAYSFYTASKKIYSTYIKALPTMQNPVTGRIHCSFNQYGAATGRFSSSSPNLQNIPSDQKLKNLGVHSSIRHSFETKPTNRLIIADYSTIELVIIADASGDEGLIANLDDLHTYVAREVLGVRDITNDNKKSHPYKIWRDVAKMVNYSIAYNVGGDSLGKQMTIALAPIGAKYTGEEATRIIQDWKGRFPKASQWLRNSAHQMLLYGSVTDGYGRKRFWDRSKFATEWMKFAAEREAMNFPIQALSASMVKLALVDTYKGLDKNKARIVSTVHDEIIVESSLEYAETAATILKHSMEKSARTVLPILGPTVKVDPAISTKYDK